MQTAIRKNGSRTLTMAQLVNMLREDNRNVNEESSRCAARERAQARREGRAIKRQMREILASI